MIVFEHIESTFRKESRRIDIPPSFLLWSININIAATLGFGPTLPLIAYAMNSV